MNLDDLNASDWPRYAITALDEWQQGDVVEIGLLAWMGTGTDDPFTTIAMERPGEGESFEGSDECHIGRGVITTQTCDVIGYGPGRKQPWVQVSPICLISDPAQIDGIKKGWLVNYSHVTANLGLNGFHAVDLRHSYPVSKNLLLGQTRTSAFSSESDVVAMAQRLAYKAGRASHHDLIGGSLAAALKGCVKEARANNEWDGIVEQFRVIVKDGTRLNPKKFDLLVVTEVASSKTLNKLFNDCVSKWKKGNKKALGEAGIQFGEVKFRTIIELPVKDYRDSVPLPVEELTREWFF